MKMTLDETITCCEEVADADCYGDKQIKCAEDYRQIAEWLRELKTLRSQNLVIAIEDEADRASCFTCAHSEDDENLCVLRKCRHAIAELKECYKPKSNAKSEPLTDNEQRIFLAAMGREEEVCKDVDAEHIRESYEDTLVWMCKEIKRKVKGVLWN